MDNGDIIMNNSRTNFKRMYAYILVLHMVLYSTF